jgi:hypothetical protein
VKLRYSLTNLLLLTALISALIVWFFDHRKLDNDYQRLNVEAANMLDIIATSRGSGNAVVGPDGTLPARYDYDFTVEEDRAAYLDKYIWPSSPK